MKKRLTLLVLVMAAALILPGCRDGSPPNEVQSTGDVSGRIIGALFGSPSVRLAEELGTARAFYSGDDLLDSLKIGTVECAVMENSAASALVLQTTGVRILSEPLLEYDLCFAIAKENAELLQAVNSALAALDENGTLHGLRDKYFARSDYTYVPPEGVPPRPGSLTLALPPDSPPYSSMDDDGEFFGMDVDVTRAICDFLGVGLQIIEFDARELVTAVWFGRADLALGWLPSEGEELVNVSDAYAHAVHVVIVRK